VAMRTQKEGFRMRLFVLASALILLTACGWTSALAQGNPQRDAPAGHRQPKANQVPQQQPLSEPDKKLHLSRVLEQNLRFLFVLRAKCTARSMSNGNPQIPGRRESSIPGRTGRAICDGGNLWEWRKNISCAGCRGPGLAQPPDPGRKQ